MTTKSGQEIKAFLDAVAEWRNRHRVSVAKLGERTGLDPSTIYRCLSGETEKPSEKVVSAIAEAFGFSLDDIWRGKLCTDKIKRMGLTPLATTSSSQISVKVFLANLPVTGRDLFGRDKELQLLDEVWADEGTKIISFVAFGGVGKSALVNEWLGRMGDKGWGGAERIYGWSFYSQGTKEDRQAASDTFLVHALEWFGDKETGESKKSPWDNGVRLAELVRQRKTLLILDGVEPLQYPPGPMEGRLKDQGLQGLLRELSHGMDGLCVITTRERIEDLEGQVGHTVKQVWLENLSSEAGMQVLRNTGVKGLDRELKETSKEFGGHALALTLLGNYLAVVHDREIRKKDLVPSLAEEEKKGGHAKRVMESYEVWLKGKAEVDTLYLMGLFDRPAEAWAIAKLKEKPAIKGLTDNIVGLSEAKWRYAVNNLRGLGLLAKEDKNRPDDLDCHPLVREHFGQKLKNNKPKAWEQAHGRLCEYYKAQPGKYLPDTLEEMEPLFRAVYHGCAAGKHQQTLDDVYWKRIRRGNEAYSVKQLGAFGSDLGAVACFFEKVWDRPAVGLADATKAILLNWAGFRLRAVGRLREATEPMKAATSNVADRNDWSNAAIAASNLSELYLTLGKVKDAVEYGRRCVEYADKSGEEFHRMSKRATLADALHQVGEAEEARRLFEEAEGMQRKRYPEFPYLYSVQGYQYCGLLLAEGKVEEVKERAKQTLEWMTNDPYAPILTVVVDKLSLGRAELGSASRDLDEAKKWLDEAVDGLRKAGTQDHLPRGLLARAELYRHQQSWDKAETDLEEAREIADRGEMKLWLCDYHLEACKLSAAQGKKERAKEHYEKAVELIKMCGYHRRDKEAAELMSDCGCHSKSDAVVFVSVLPNAKEVYIVGDFNNWDPGKTKMEKIGSSGTWQTELQLQPGKYRYRLVVDGKWQHDPHNEVVELNSFGEINSIIEVG